MKKIKYIQANEIVKPGKTSWEFVGIELERTKDSVSILGVGDTNRWNDIEVEQFEIEKYKFKVIDKERVHHLFSVAMKENQKQVIEAEVGLLRARRSLKFCENKVKQYFGKPLSISDLPDYRGDT